MVGFRIIILISIISANPCFYTRCNVKVKEIKKENRNRVLFEGPIFTQEWFRDDEAIDNIEAYMF